MSHMFRLFLNAKKRHFAWSDSNLRCARERFAGSFQNAYSVVCIHLENLISGHTEPNDGRWKRRQRNQTQKTTSTISNTLQIYLCLITLFVFLCCDWWIFICWFSGGFFQPHVNVYAKSNIYNLNTRIWKEKKFIGKKWGNFFQTHCC